ncbi:hypothetical protein OSH11_17205 [Kaistia dalseonensis]|uniref:Uncharacterized protein n=1 Tax=Kaistia dalseonensis TaxID=410840 RepID=A0ABU0H9R7_9HYPH|nr:hypothetical protein [Kaistia dalseonensis]MCX5496448.1 hypothetical protein [Kaistia dalseonensis]MDQ0439069.1 hypothetical protein [Kaistia dalseonensis]
MPQSTETVVHERRVRVRFDRRELELLIAEAAAREAGILVTDVVCKVTFEDATEGSPAYRVGVRAVVDIVEKLGPPGSAA